MISESSKTLFSEIFIYLARGEKKLEVVRQVLCEISDFEPYTAFKRIASGNKNFVTAKDLHIFLSDNDVFYPEEAIAETFLSHYDYDSDGRLCYAEAVLPGDNPVLRTEVSQRPIGRGVGERLRDSVEYTLAKLLNEEISLYLESEPHKKMLLDIESFSYALLFSIIDRDDSGFIDFTNLNAFFESQGIYPYEEEIISILKRLDKDDDGRITLEEFKNGLVPRNLKPNLATNPSIFASKVIFSPSRDRKLQSPKKNYPFEAIRKASSPSKSQMNTSLKTKSPIRNSHKHSSSKKQLREDDKSIQDLKMEIKKDFNSSKKKSLRDREEEKTIQELKMEIKKDLNLSKRIHNSPIPKRTPEKRAILRSFHQQDSKRKNATDSKIGYKQLKTSWKSPIPVKKTTHFETMKKSLEKEMEISKQIHQSFHKKSESFVNSLSKMSIRASPVKPKIQEYGRTREMKDVADFFKKIVVLEREIERVKQDLALRPDFNLMDFFSIFDKNEKGYLNQNEIRHFLSTMGLNPTSDTFPLFLKRFDRNNFGRIKFCDFVEIFTPSQTDYADLLKQRKPVTYDIKFVSPEEMLSPETRKVINELLTRIISNEKDIENERRILMKLIGNQLKDIFETIDLNKNGVLSIKELKFFLETNEFFITERDASALFSRFDHYKKGFISFTEFLQELQHKI